MRRRRASGFAGKYRLCQAGSVLDRTFSTRLPGLVPIGSAFPSMAALNPYLWAGMPMLADAESRVLTLFFLLHVLFGPTVGIHLEIPLHLAIGFLAGI